MYGQQNMKITVISIQKKREKNLPDFVKTLHTALYRMK